MIPKAKRLTRKECDALIEGSSQVIHTPSLFARFVTSREFKAAVAVSRKVAKKAVDRNKLRRIVYDGFQHCENLNNSLVHILVSVKKQAVKKDKTEIQNEVIDLCRKI
ncbi:MAG: ribonuclease P protein component [Candidatus Campbellbacteria bacterium]|nr:ribonuclease P protein component [Candidatus Campbellbacteria bacterium]